jgi:hypothetical protein
LRAIRIVEHTLDVGKDTLVLRRLREEALNSAAHHGVLSHQDNTLATEGLPDLVHLLGGDIVDGDNENAFVLCGLVNRWSLV